MPGGELATTGRVDAVLVRGESTYVFSGGEYYRYRGRLMDGEMDPGYPKKIDANDEDIPRWASIDAVFTWDGGEYFIKGMDYVRRDLATGVSQSGRVRDRWELPARTRVQAVLVRGATLFLIFGDMYAKIVTDDPAESYTRELKDNPDNLPTAIRAAADVNGTPYFFGEDTFTVGADATRHPTRPLGKIATVLNTTGKVDAAYLSGDRLFLTSGLEYYRYTLDGDTVPLIADAGYPKALPRAVDAAFQRGDQRYILSGEEYTLIPAAQEPSTLGAFTPIEGNWRSLPPDFATTYTGVLDTESELLLFLGGEYAVHPKTGVLHRPYEYAALPHEVVRLTSSTAFELNRRLLVGGVPALLAPETQEIDELPSFRTATEDSAAETGTPPPRRRTPPRSRCSPTSRGCRSAPTWTSRAPTAATTGRSSSTRRCSSPRRSTPPSASPTPRPGTSTSSTRPSRTATGGSCPSSRSTCGRWSPDAGPTWRTCPRPSARAWARS
nr:hypothetical protein GCM10020093_007970 [Planobispora longispora]